MQYWLTGWKQSEVLWICSTTSVNQLRFIACEGFTVIWSLISLHYDLQTNSIENWNDKLFSAHMKGATTRNYDIQLKDPVEDRESQLLSISEILLEFPVFLSKFIKSSFNWTLFIIINFWGEIIRFTIIPNGKWKMEKFFFKSLLP